MSRYCITHEVEMQGISRPGEDCLVVECPPPALPENWDVGMVEPDEEELILMDMNAELLEIDLGL